MISVALATYNGEKYIREQINSILNQTYKDFELVICDDCSTDSTVKILENYLKNDKRIKLFLNKNNLGFKKNFERVISFCHGEFIAFSDQDDIWQPWKLEKELQLITNKDLVCTNALMVDANGKSLGYTMKEVVGYSYFPKSKEDQFLFLLQRNIVQGSTILARTEFLRKWIPIPAAFTFHDYYFALVACIENGIAYLNECSIFYRQHTNNITKNNKINESFLKKLYITKWNENTKKKFNNTSIKKVKEMNELKQNINFIEKKKIIEDYIRYRSEVNNKTFFSTLYFIRNVYFITADRNFLKNFILCIRKIIVFIIITIIKK